MKGQILNRFLWMLAASLLLISCEQDANSTWPGYVEGNYIDVAAEVGGKLTSLNVQKGQSVEKDANLYSLDENPERLEFVQIQAHLDALQEKIKEANAQMKLAGQELARIQRLAKEDYSSMAALDAAKASKVAAQARVAFAKAEYAAQQAGLERINWILSRKHQKATEAAIVEDIWFEVGEWIAPGKPVLRLRAKESVRLRFFVPETAIASLTIGEQVQISIDGMSPFTATIEAVAEEPEFTPPVLYAEGARGNLVFWVEAKPESSVASALHPGLPIEVSSR